jgi:DNA-directed RNA polymerase specialized sigma24 family protein
MGWLYETNKFNDKEFQNVEHWLNMLKSENSSAIQYLYAKCNKQITQVAKSYKLSNEDTEELICDCMVLFIQKLQSNEYTYQGWDPISYVIEIAKFKSLNYYRRKNKHATVELEQKETELSNGELLNNEFDIEKILTLLDTNCKKLIELKYLEE